MSDAVIRMGYSDAEVEAGLKHTAAHLKHTAEESHEMFSKIREGFGTALEFAGIGLGLEGIKQLIEGFTRISVLSEQLDTSASSLQRLANMARAAGTDAEAAAMGLNRVNKALALGEGVEVFRKLGIDVREYLSLDADEQMLMLAEAFQKAERNGHGLAEAYTLIGKQAAELLPLLRRHVDLLKEASEATVVSDEEISQIREFNELLEDTAQKVKVFAVKKFFDFGHVFDDYIAAVKDLMNGGTGYAGVVRAQIEREGARPTPAADAWGTDAAFDEHERRKRRAAAADAAEAAVAAKAAKAEWEALAHAADEHSRGAKAANEAAEAAEKAAAAAQKEADAVNKARDARLRGIRDLETEMQILLLRSKHHDRAADAMEKEYKIKQEARKIVKETGIDEAKALEIARQKAALEDKINRTHGGSGSTIHGYSQTRNPNILHGSALDAWYNDRRTPFFDKHLHTPNLDAHPWKHQADAARQSTRTMEEKLDAIIANTAPLKDK